MLQILSGTVLKGTYRIDRMIGMGSMGPVYRATHLGLDKAMAVKLLSPDALTTPQSFARFKREAMVVSGVNHPAMVHVIDFGEEQGTPYIVMEYVDGIDLAEYIAHQGPMPPRQAVAVMRQFVSLLRTMHAQGIIHRNLKPRNIRVLQDGEEDGQFFVKVLAFSLATVFGEPIHPAIQGTPTYMAPELLAGGQIDQRTDLYAAGLIFQEMLSGERPPPPPPLTLRWGARPLPPAMPVPNVVRQTLRMFCEERPQDRFQSAAEAEHALRACEDALRPTPPVAEHNPTRPSAQSKPLSREKPPPANGLDVAILTVIQPELFAVLDALGISASQREKDAHGTVYFRGSLRSQLTGRDYELVVTCIGAAGNYDASAAAYGVIAKHRPRALLLLGIAAGMREKVQIGEVVLSERVVAYEPAAVVSSGDERSSNTEPRPEIDRLPHSMNQDVTTYRPEPARLEALFRDAGGQFPVAPAGREDEFRNLVATTIKVRAATIASGEKLLRDPAKLRAVKQEQHGKVEVGEMEAAGLVAACRRANVPWLVIRGISDFGDPFKDDRFHDFASRAAATVLADFLAYGLSIPARSGQAAVPVPHYPDEQTRLLSLQLQGARERKKRLQDSGVGTAQVDQEILALRRHLREGGRLRAGDSLGDGRYLLIESVGSGGFATIWRAHDQQAQRIIAIKVLHANLAGDEERRERFFRGARRMAELQHPAVVQVIEQHGEDGGYQYFVMEYMPGGNLRQAVLERLIMPDRIIPIILRVGEALALAHSKGIIHRDIKPANILLDSQGQPHLTDFDLVGALDTTGGTKSGAMGTIVYAAPECLERPQEADPRADVYGLGMTAIFGLHGADLPLQILRGPEPFLEQLPCAEGLKAVLHRATSMVPGDRYEDAGEFITALSASGE